MLRASRCNTMNARRSSTETDARRGQLSRGSIARSLLSFKAKFQPEYRRLYMAYPDPSTLPATGDAIGRAFLPDLTARQGLRSARKLVRLH